MGDLEAVLKDFCEVLYTWVGELAFILILLSSIIFALGQMFGAETRARANVWATNMLTGAIIGIVIVVLLPSIMAMLLGLQYDPNGGACSFVVPNSGST